MGISMTYHKIPKTKTPLRPIKTIVHEDNDKITLEALLYLREVLEEITILISKTICQVGKSSERKTRNLQDVKTAVQLLGIEEILKK